MRKWPGSYRLILKIPLYMKDSKMCVFFLILTSDLVEVYYMNIN